MEGSWYPCPEYRLQNPCFLGDDCTHETWQGWPFGVAAGLDFPEASLSSLPVRSRSREGLHFTLIRAEPRRGSWFALSAPPSLADSGLTQKPSVRAVNTNSHLMAPPYGLDVCAPPPLHAVKPKLQMPWYEEVGPLEGDEVVRVGPL